MKKIILSILILLLIGLGYIYYLYNKPHRKIANEFPEFSLDAEELVNEYNLDENKANAKYLGKVVEVFGTIAEKSKDKKGNYNITLQGPDLNGIGCEFEKTDQNNLSTLKEGQKIKIKGICAGMLMDVVLVDCVLEKNNTN